MVLQTFGVNVEGLKDCLTVEQFLKAEVILEKRMPWNSIIWSKVAQNIFGSYALKYRKWLSVVWHSNHRNVQSAVFKHFRKPMKLTDQLDKTEEDNSDAVSDHDFLCSEMAEESNERNYCSEVIPSPEEVVEPEDAGKK